MNDVQCVVVCHVVGVSVCVCAGKTMTDGKKKQGEMAVMGDVVILLCILLSVGSQLVGMLVPGWWVYPANDSGSINASTTTYGLWVTVICVEGDCNEIPTDTSGSNGSFRRKKEYCQKLEQTFFCL